MISARHVARELLPYVVIFWATFALLGGALENTRSAETGGTSVAAKSGLGLCAITVACLLQGVARRIRPLIKRAREFFEARRVWGSRLEPLVLAYREPPLSRPSLHVLQVLRA